MSNKQSFSSNRIIIESLSMDLLRAAMGLYRGSKDMAETFEKEALNRSQELKPLSKSDPYIKTLILKIEESINSKSSDKAEDLLMYSVLFKNLALTRYSGQ